MRIFFRIVYGIAFFIFIFISEFRRTQHYILSIIWQIIQRISFKFSKRNVLHKHQNKINRINDENTKKHLRELANVLKEELNKYRKDISPPAFYKLKKLIERNYLNMDLRNLTIAYKVFFETSKASILPELAKLIKSKDFSDKSRGV